jgi:rod shape-determining protein MreB
MFKRLRGILSNDISIDLGTANTLVYAKGEGIVLNEPSVIAIKMDQKGNKSIAAVGAEAKKMLGRTPGNIETIKPLKDGVIADFYAAEKMIQHFIKKTHKSNFLSPCPRILICVPCNATQVERKAIKESAEGAGAREVYIIEEPMAAAIGSGLPVTEATGSMVVDIGGGTSEIAVISLNGIVYAESVRVGGDKFNDSIMNHVRREHGIAIGEATAEKIKHTIGNAFGDGEIKEIEVRGRNIAEGVPRSFIVNSDEIRQALHEPLQAIVTGVLNALEKSPPELSSDISAGGMVLTGGGALLEGLDKLIESSTGVPVHIAENPLDCVAKGGGIALELIDQHGQDFF